ncbi:MAG: glycosyltransferase family 4 protein [Leptolyngbyaceae bacterium]|nr:glycosyltransferase family 4 protein [Leptolyngbyaceae bacterium]
MSAWLMAKEQARLGHTVTFVVHSAPDLAGLDYAADAGFRILHVPANFWQYDSMSIQRQLNTRPPDVVHMHSVFQAKQATLAMQLQRRGIPYVIKPAGGLLPEVLKRGRLQKLMYSFLLEKRRFKNAGAIAVVTPREEEPVLNFVPRYPGIIRWMPNPVDTQSLEGLSWQGIQADTASPEPKRVVYLGRFDVLHKGIDRLVAIARHLPDIEFHLYGTEDDKTKQWLDTLRQDQPTNVMFHRPVYGAEKFRVLSEASLYIQPARWEVFGISIAEAMYLGTPCAVADSINFAELFQQHDLGLVFPSNNAEQAAQRLSDALANPTQLQHWSANAQAFAYQHFEPAAVAKNYLQLYTDVLLSTHPHLSATPNPLSIL